MQEELKMKATMTAKQKAKARPHIPYPNAATRREMLQKFLDLLIMGAVGAGFGAVALLLLAMG